MDTERVRRWAKDGLITADQADKLVATLPPPGAPDPAAAAAPESLTRVLVACAGLNGLALFGLSRFSGLAAPAHALVLLWMLSVAPLAYLLRRSVYAALLCLLYMAWVGAFVYGGISAGDAVDRLPFVPVTYLAAGVALFAVGGTHYLLERLAPVARVYRLAGLQVSLLALFALGLETFASRATGMTDWRSAEASDRFVLCLLLLCVAAAIPTAINWRLSARVPALTRSEGPISLALIGGVLLYTVVPLPTLAYVLLWNAVLFALVSAVTWVGYTRRDARLVDIGGGALALLLIARYVSVAAGRLPVGTLLLGLLPVTVVVGVALWILRSSVAEAAAEDEAAKVAAQAGPGPTVVVPVPAPAAVVAPVIAVAPPGVDTKRDADLDPEIRDLLREARASKAAPS